MKKKLLLVVLAFVCVITCALGLAACNINNGDDGDDKTQMIDVEGVTLNKTTLTLEVGGEETLTATVAPNNATNKAVTWSVSPAGIVTVNGGKVIAVAAGTATVAATTVNNKTATCSVTVNKATVPVTGIILSKSEITLGIDDKETLTAEITPYDATNKTVMWASSNENVAMVDDKGEVTAIAEGTAVIVATADGKSATCSITVYTPIYTPTENLFYSLNADGESYYVSGIGSATDTDIVIAAEYNGKPVTRIGNKAFVNNHNITSVRIPYSVTEIDNQAFWDCIELVSVYLEDGVTSIGTVAFGGCENLIRITMSNSILSIGLNAFDSCKNLTDINFKGTKAQWEAVSKEYLWNYGTGKYTIHCTDGDLAK